MIVLNQITLQVELHLIKGIIQLISVTEYLVERKKNKNVMAADILKEWMFLLWRTKVLRKYVSLKSKWRELQINSDLWNNSCL